MNHRIGFIGAGKMGTALGLFFQEHGEQVAGYFSRSYESAKKAAAVTESAAFDQIATLIKESDRIFLTVPDGQIKAVWDEIKDMPELTHKFLCHTSGSLSSEVFHGAESREVETASLHPICAIGNAEAYDALNQAVFSLEGKESKACEALKEQLTSYGNVVVPVLKEHKMLYHEACVVASNFLVGSSYLSERMLMTCGFSEETARSALLPLMKGSLSNIERLGSIEALSGPVERSDAQTLSGHLNALSSLEQEHAAFDISRASNIYKQMSGLLLEAAQKKHPEKDYEACKEIVK